MATAEFSDLNGRCDYCGGLDPYTVFLHQHDTVSEWMCSECAAADEGRSSETLDERAERYQTIYRKGQ